MAGLALYNRVNFLFELRNLADSRSGRILTVRVEIGIGAWGCIRDGALRIRMLLPWLANDRLAR